MAVDAEHSPGKKRLIKYDFKEKEKYLAMLIVHPPMTNCGMRMSGAGPANLHSTGQHSQHRQRKWGDFTVVAYGHTDKYAHAEKCEEFLSFLPHRHRTLEEKIEFSPRKVFCTCILFIISRNRSRIHSHGMCRSGCITE